MDRLSSLKVIDTLLNEAKTLQDDATMTNALLHIDVTRLYPSFFHSPLVTVEELKPKRNKKDDGMQTEHTSRIQQVVDLYDAMMNCVLHKKKADKPEMYKLGTSSVQLVVWICNLYPLLLYGCDQTKHLIYKRTTRNILNMSRILYKSLPKESKTAKFAIFINDLHDLLHDLNEVWLYLQVTENNTEPRPAIFIDLLTNTRKLKNVSSMQSVCGQIRVATVTDCLRYMNATLTLLYYLSSNQRLNDDRPHPIYNSSTDSAFLTRDISVFELLISIIKLGSPLTKTNAIEYLADLVRINSLFITAQVTHLIRNKCVLAVLQDRCQIAWPNYRKEPFDDKLAKLILHLQCNIFTDFNSAIPILRHNIEQTRSKALSIRLVEIFRENLRTSSNLQVLVHEESHILIETIFKRGIMTSDLLLTIFSVSKQQYRIPSDPPQKKARRDSQKTITYNAFGLREDESVQPLFSRLEDYLQSVIANENDTKTDSWKKDLILTVKAIMQYVWLQNTDIEETMTEAYEATMQSLSISNCSILHAIVEYICSLMEKQHSLALEDMTRETKPDRFVCDLFMELLHVYSSHNFLKNKQEILIATDIASSKVHERLISAANDALLYCDKNIYTSTSEVNGQVVRNACMKVLCFGYALNPQSSESIKFEKWFTSQALYHHNDQVKMQFVQYMHCFLEACHRFELVNGKTGKAEKLGKEFITCLKTFLRATADSGKFDIETGKIVASELGLVAPSCLGVQADEFLISLLDLCFDVLLDKSPAPVANTFIASFPSIYHSISTKERVTAPIEKNFWTRYKQNLRNIVKKLIQPAKNGVIDIVLHTPFVEELLIGTKKNPAVCIGHMMNITFQSDYGTGLFVNKLRDMLISPTHGINERAGILLSMIAKAGLSICTFDKNSILLKRVIFALKDGICCGNDDVEVQALDYIDLIRKRSGCFAISEILPPNDELFDDWLINVLSNSPDYPSIIESVANILFDSTGQVFLHHLKERVIPKLVDLKRDQAISNFAKVLNENDFWGSNFCLAVSHLLATGKLTGSEAEEYSKFMEKICKKPLTSMLVDLHVYLITTVCSQLKLETKEDEAKAVNVLNDCYKFIAHHTQCDIQEKKNQLFLPLIETCFSRSIADYFRQTLEDIILNQKMLIGILKCLKCMLISMGSVCKYNTSHIISLLKTVAAFAENLENCEGIITETCEVWYDFIRLLDDEKLGDILPQIVVLLLPFKHEEKAIEAFRYMFIEKTNVLRLQLDNIPSLPNTPELKDINRVLASCEPKVANSMNAKYSILERQLKKSLNGMKYDSEDVQRMSAIQLKQIIEDNYQIICEWVENSVIFDKNRGSSTVSSSIKQTTSEFKPAQLIYVLITVLMQKCSSARDMEDRILYAECLGLLGAIDPSRFAFESNVNDPRTEMNDVDLAYTIIDSYLYKEYKSEKGDKHKIASYCVQELLKVLLARSNASPSNITSSDLTTFAWWNRMEKNKQEDLQALISSSFVSVTRKETSGSAVKKPFFTPGKSFRSWIKSFSRYFARRASGGRGDIFRCLSPAYVHFLPMTQFLLPYIVQSVILTGTDEDRNDLILEFETVLENALVLEDEDRKSHEHLQAVVSVIELLGSWLRRFKYDQATQKSKPDSELVKSYNRIEKLVDSISNDLMARAAFNSKSYTRSLLYYEKYMRSVLQEFQQKNKMKAKHLPRITGDRAALIADYSASTGINPLLFLQQIHKNLDVDVDILQGIASLRTTTTLEEEIIEHEAHGNWNEALHCYELALQKEPDDIGHQLNMLKCNRNLGHLQTMLRSIDGALARLQTDNTQLKTYAVQSAWRLGEWELVTEYLAGADESDFEVHLAKTLCAYSRNDREAFRSALYETKRNIISPLSTACLESYESAYQYIVKFQMIMELEQSFGATLQQAKPVQQYHTEKLSHQWNSRFKIMTDSLDVREPIISLRRVLFGMHRLEKEEGNSWLTYAKLARKRKNTSQAKSAILQANEYAQLLPHFSLNYAKVLHASGSTHQALLVLENQETVRSIQKMSQPLADDITPNHLLAKMKLLTGIWNESLRRKQSTVLRQQYEDIIKMEKTWEEGYFHLAKYIDTLLVNRLNSAVMNIPEQKAPEPKETTRRGRRHSDKSDNAAEQSQEAISNAIETSYSMYVVDIIQNYGNCLKYGIKHIYHALPRLITLVCNVGDLGSDRTSEVNSKVINILLALFEVIHPSIWMVNLSQITSRSSHKNNQTRSALQKMLKNLLATYPKHVMWSFSRLYNEGKKNMEIEKIYQEAGKMLGKKNIVLTNHQSLTLHFIKFCTQDYKAAQDLKFSEITTLKKLPAVLTKHSPQTHVMIPLQSNLSPDILSTRTKAEHILDDEDEDLDTSGAFSTLDIAGFDEKVKVMTSLAKPRRLCFIGTDRKNYPFLVKPKDDLRRDSRFMEFSRMLNHLFMKNPETRRRKLYIRTFSAIPLTESIGLIEWVENTSVFRQCLLDGDDNNPKSSYAPSQRDQNAMHLRCAPPKLPDFKWDPPEDYMRNKLKIDKREMLKTMFPSKTELFRKVIDDTPAVFHRWFYLNFPDPTKWFQARLNYVRTCAVMSMVGWTMGLGDRHTENILMDSLTGDLLHIDLNMLFGEGQLLQVKERVPFRLTLNMIDAMGITGYEGTFRVISEVTLETLRQNKDSLMSILDAFTHDPSIKLKHELKPLETIERKLKGLEIKDLVSSNKNNGSEEEADEFRICSVQAQVDQLISMATDDDRLSHMWPYWYPWF